MIYSSSIEIIHLRWFPQLKIIFHILCISLDFDKNMDKRLMVDLFQISTSQNLEYGNLLLSCVSHFYILFCFQHQTRIERKSLGIIICSHGQNTTPEAIRGLCEVYAQTPLTQQLKQKTYQHQYKSFAAKQKYKKCHSMDVCVPIMYFGESLSPETVFVWDVCMLIGHVSRAVAVSCGPGSDCL